ncbi:MAG TPA: AAA family ATPase [Polyangiales bacterium]|nr:AAA family ATPase [Polyangiales bacterium]
MAEGADAVVVKVAREPFASTLIREAEVLTALRGSSASILQLHDHGSAADATWIATEWIRGQSLAAQIATRASPTEPAPDDRTLELLETVARSLAVVHEHGIVHGDVTPGNILLRSDGSPVLIDFGSAFHDSACPQREHLRAPARVHATPGYAAPEITASFPGDARRDLYALGCVLWHVLTGLKPKKQLQAGDLERVPAHLRELLVSLLEPNPDARLRSALEVASVLANLRAGACAHLARPAPRALVRSRFVGRADALARLHAALGCAADGRGSATLVVGEAGIGKSRLLNEIIARADATGFQVLSSACLDPESVTLSPRPAILQPFIQHQLVNPELLDARASAQLARARALDGIWSALAQQAQATPVLLIIDDLHWADDLTFAFASSARLEQVARLRLCVIASWRSDGHPSPLPPTSWQSIQVTALGLDEVRELARGMFGPERLPEGFDRWLLDRTSGNPLHVTQCAHELVRAGPHALSSFRSADETPLLQLGDGPPQSLATVLTQRLARLSGEARGCARVAAIVGEEFGVDDLLPPFRAVMPELELSAALEELVFAHVLEPIVEGRYRFTHNLYARGSLATVQGVDECALMRRLAQYYDAHTGASAGVVAWTRLGTLWSRAREWERAFDCLVTAAGREDATHGTTRLRALLRGALSAYAELSGAARTQRALAAAKTHARLGELLHRDACYSEADNHFEQALSIGGDRLDRIARASLLRRRALALRAPNRFGVAHELIDAAQSELGAEADSVEWRREWIEVGLARFWLLYYSRKPFGELLQSLESAVLQHGTASQRSDFDQCACASLLAASRYRGCERSTLYAARALQAIREQSELSGRVADACMVAAFPLLWREPPHWQQAIALLQEAEAGALWLDDLTLLAQVRTYLALAHRRCREVDKAEALARAAYIAADRADSWGYRGAALASLAWVMWRRGDLHETELHARNARACWRDGTLRHPFQSFLNLVWADALRVSERFHEARKLLEELLAPDLQQLPEPLEASIVAAVKCEVDDARTLDAALREVSRRALRAGYL